MEFLPGHENPCPCALWKACICVAVLTFLRAAVIAGTFILPGEGTDLIIVVTFALHSILAFFAGPGLAWGVLQVKPRWIRSTVICFIVETFIIALELVFFAITRYTNPMTIVFAILLIPFLVYHIFSIYIVNVYWKLQMDLLKELETP